MKHRKFTKQQEKDMKEIVDFYMQYVTGEHYSIRESLEYFWKCMSDYTIEDYLEVAREGKANMNNKPVAYAMFRDGEYYDAIHPDEQAKTVGEYDIPLYIHQAKTLTDEEIESWITEWAKDLYGTLYVEPTDHQRTMAIKMARAILKKASEK
jgi:hypothetical protein